MQYSQTTGYATAELAWKLISRLGRPARPGKPAPRRTILRPIRPARPHARRAAINESLAAA